MDRYNDLTFILDTPFLIGLKYIKKAIEKENEKSLWEVWLTLYPIMTKKNFVSFADFKGKAVKKRKEKTDDEMLTMVKVLNAALGGKVIEL